MILECVGNYNNRSTRDCVFSRITMKRRRSKRLASNKRAKNDPILQKSLHKRMSEFEVLTCFVSFLVNQEPDDTHQIVASLIWEFARYERCYKGSCGKKVHLHIEACPMPGVRVVHHRWPNEISFACGFHDCLGKKCHECDVHYWTGLTEEADKCVFCKKALYY